MFKKIRILFVVLILLSSFPLKSKAEVSSSYPVTPREQIENFFVESTLHPNGKVTVIERIKYNFGSAEKHGIFRLIPVVYTDKLQTKFVVRLKVKSVVDENDVLYPYSISYENDNVRIKIGDENKLVSGIKTYVIAYEVDRTISYFDDHDEWYWNVAGNSWDIPIQKAEIIVTLPREITKTELHHACYTGLLGSANQTCEPLMLHNTEITQLKFAATEILNPKEGMTIVLGVPKGVVEEPNLEKRIGWFIADNWPLATPFISAVVLFILWYIRGRDPKGKEIIIPEYEPPQGLFPIEIGTIYNEKLDKRDIASLFIDLATRGFIKISEVSSGSKDYEFIKLKDHSELARPYEQVFFKDLFGADKTRRLSSLKNTFYETTKEIKKEVYHSLTKQEFFVKNPATTRLIYIIVGVIIMVLGIPFSGTNPSTSFWNLLAFIIAGGLFIVFASIMPRRTKKGALVKEHIEGFKLFLSVTEKERIKFHNAPEKKPELFEKFLPFAMVLKVEKEWAKQFEGIYTKPPSWYEGNWKAFSVGYLTSSLGNFSSSAGSTITTSPARSSGFSSGSSGGGFGGGGGGSW